MQGLAPFQSSNLALADQGSIAAPVTLDFTESSIQNFDITLDRNLGRLDYVQSVYVDNADNSVVCELLFYGAAKPYRVTVQPFFQGWLPVTMPAGPVRFSAKSNSGAKIEIILANFAMPYYTSGPANGVAQVPALVNQGFAPLALNAGNNELVAGLGAETIKLYRGIFNVDQPTNLLFTDGNGGTVLFSAALTAGGSLTFDVSGVPWFNTSEGNNLVLNSSAAVNLFGGFGYVQS